MPPPLDEALRDAILADIRAGQKARNRIARDHDVSPSTVTKIAQDEGLTEAFDRSQTIHATRARNADSDARQAELRARLLETGHMLVGRIDRPVPIWGIGQDVDETGGRTARIVKDTIEPGPKDWKDLMAAVASASSQAVAIQRASVDAEGTGQAAGLLEKFEQSLRKARQERDQQAAE